VNKGVWLSALIAVASIASLQAPDAASAQATKCDHAKFRLIIDVGHTVEEGGAVSARGVDEYVFNLRLAQRIEKTLLDAGFSRTLLQITGGNPISGLTRRVAAANKANADLLLSIHHDSVPDRFLESWEYEGKPQHFCDRFKGHSVFVSLENAQRDASLRFARLLGERLKSRGLRYTPHYTEAFMRERRRELLDSDFGVYRFDALYVLRATQMPAVLLEAGSIINREEEVQLSGDERPAQIAASVLDAVEDFCVKRTLTTSGRDHQAK